MTLTRIAPILLVLVAIALAFAPITTLVLDIAHDISIHTEGAQP